MNILFVLLLNLFINLIYICSIMEVQKEEGTKVNKEDTTKVNKEDPTKVNKEDGNYLKQLDEVPKDILKELELMTQTGKQRIQELNTRYDFLLTSMVEIQRQNEFDLKKLEDETKSILLNIIGNCNALKYNVNDVEKFTKLIEKQKTYDNALVKNYQQKYNSIKKAVEERAKILDEIKNITIEKSRIENEVIDIMEEIAQNIMMPSK